MFYPPENFQKHLFFLNKIINFAERVRSEELGVRRNVETYQLHHKK